MTNATQNPDIVETQIGKVPEVPSMLTILVDLSHPSLADGKIRSRMNLIEILKCCAKGVAIGAEATIISGKNDGSDPIGVFLIAPDAGGESKAAMLRAIALVDELQKDPDRYAVAKLP